MSFFNPEIPKKQKEISHHPWKNRIKDIYSHMYKYGHNSVKNPVYPLEKPKVLAKNRIKFTVIGNRIAKEFIYCMHLVKGLHKYRQKEFEAPVIRGVTSVEWPKVWNDLKILYGGLTFCLLSEVAILKDDKFLGGIDELKALIESKYVYYFHLDYHRERIQQFANFVKSSGRPCAYLQIAIDDVPIGTLIFMLYADLVPNTCENFLRLCEARKGGYGGTPIHRIVEDCWIQCGGFGLKSSNLDCENFIVQHDRRGVICMANNGRHIDCSTQFFVLLQPAPWMAHKYVAFGQLIDGEKTLQKIEKVPTFYEAPISKIAIYNAGVFNMECQNIFINKNTHEYLHGHIEDLFTIGKMFYEELLERVFSIIESKPILEEDVEEENNDNNNLHATQRFMRKKEDIEKQVPVKHNSSSESEGNNEFDVDVYQYEFESYSYSKQESVHSLIVNPEKPFYLPLTDVPYPGEVDSTYDLKKFLKGDYCLESDLEKNPIKRKEQESNAKVGLNIPRHVREALFEDDDTDDDDDESASSLDSDNRIEINEYLKENIDKVSFAGPVVRKIANVRKKYDVLQYTEGKIDMANKLLTDEELRILRLTIKEYKNTRNKKVGINVNSDATKMKKRPVTKIEPENEDGQRKDQVELFRSIRRTSEDQTSNAERASDAYRPSYAPPRQSVLARLYDDVRDSDDDIEGPTLKDYKPLSELHQRNFMLTNSPTHMILNDDDSRDKHRRHSQPDKRFIDKFLGMQHGNKSRKISSDYVRAIDYIENNLDTLRSFEYAKKRPWITLPQYQLKNQRYEEELAAAKSGSQI